MPCLLVAVTLHAFIYVSDLHFASGVEEVIEILGLLLFHIDLRKRMLKSLWLIIILYLLRSTATLCQHLVACFANEFILPGWLGNAMARCHLIQCLQASFIRFGFIFVELSIQQASRLWLELVL